MCSFEVDFPPQQIPTFGHPMKMPMLARLHYLFAEGFEVSSISGYDDDSGEGNAKILLVERDAKGAPRLRSEVFDVDSEEMQQCTNYFLARISKPGQP